jgi:hypothetical protein
LPVFDVPGHVFNQSLAGIFHEIENMLKPLLATMVRVGHNGTVMDQAKLGKATHLALVQRRAFILNQRQIVPIHREDRVMRFKVDVLNLPGAQARQVIPAFGGMLLRAIIGRAAGW